ncbi:type I restriction enzyme HsdR N-terminal domain-containing protein [Haladaptatus sp. SPP-AMP-3]|uniref:type I restriction enzyme HsdR N-terminal domain-containing protein n=1 Tax=Haladaptatus sp. SPP-AMP-3 TaxID=3121295 RepID=UPI003C2C64A0
MEYPRDDDTIDDRADYVLFRDDSPAVTVEAKRAGRSLRAGLKQTKRYMRLIGTDWGLVTNGERYVLFRSDPNSEEPAEEIVLDAELEELPSHQHQLADTSKIPSTSIDN